MQVHRQGNQLGLPFNSLVFAIAVNAAAKTTFFCSVCNVASDLDNIAFDINKKATFWKFAFIEFKNPCAFIGARLPCRCPFYRSRVHFAVSGLQLEEELGCFFRRLQNGERAAF